MATEEAIGPDSGGEDITRPIDDQIGAEVGGRDPMSSVAIREQLRDYIVANYLFGSGTVGDDVSLLDEGVLDSMGVLELVLFVEETFDVRIAEYDVVPENFDSIGAIASFIEVKWNDVRQALAS